jgi:hypothetical protein
VHSVKDADGESHTFKFNTAVKSDMNTRYYYVALADCYLEEYDAHPPSFDYDVTFLNGNMVFPGDDESKAIHSESHLPADEMGLYSVQLWVLAIMTLAGAGFAFMVKKTHDQVGQMHLIVVLLGVAYIMQLGSIFCEVLHLRQYRLDGKGLRWRHTWFAADFLSEGLQGLSEFILSFLLIAVGAGWTLTADASILGAGDGSSKASQGVLSKPAELFKRATPASIFIVSLFATQLTLEALGRKYDDDFNQFHDHEHWPGYLLMWLRVVMCGVFGTTVGKNMLSNNSQAVVSFLRKLLVLGIVWFLAFPTLVVSSSYLVPYKRHRTITGGAITCQCVALAGLALLFLKSKEYAKISSLSRMGSVSVSTDFSVAAGGSSKMCVD